MNTGLLQTLVEEDFGYKREGRNWGRAEQHSSLVVNEELQKWFWNSEGIGGDVLSYLIKIRGLKKDKAEEVLEIREKFVNGSILEEKPEREYVPYEKLVDLLWMLGKNNRDYWYHRCLNDKTIDRFRLGFYNGWYTLPLYDKGQFIDFQCRRDEPNKVIRKWYKDAHTMPVLLNMELLNLVDTIYITEGTIDSLLLIQEGISAVAQSGGANYWNSEWYPYFNRIKRVYYIADNDNAGLQGAERIATSLGMDKVLIYTFDGKPEKYDTVDYFRDGGNAKDLKSLVESNSRYLFEIGELNERVGKKKSKRVSRMCYT